MIRYFYLLLFCRNGDPSKILKGSSTLIDGLSGDGNNIQTDRIANIATNVLVGSTKVSGDVLEAQPAIADAGKNIAADSISIGSKIVGEVSKRPELVANANEVRKTVQNLFQGLFG